MRVMIIDDQLYFRSPMVRLLEQRGFRVVACRNSVEALEQAVSADRCAVAFVEMNLPEVCGIEIAAQLRRVAPWMTVYLTTPTDRAATPEDWSGDGVAGILQKPIPIHQLAELCTESIERCRLAFDSDSGSMTRLESHCAGSSQ